MSGTIDERTDIADKLAELSVKLTELGIEHEEPLSPDEKIGDLRKQKKRFRVLLKEAAASKPPTEDSPIDPDRSAPSKGSPVNKAPATNQSVPPSKFNLDEVLSIVPGYGGEKSTNDNHKAAPVKTPKPIPETKTSPGKPPDTPADHQGYISTNEVESKLRAAVQEEHREMEQEVINARKQVPQELQKVIKVLKRTAKLLGNMSPRNEELHKVVSKLVAAYGLVKRVPVLEKEKAAAEQLTETCVSSKWKTCLVVTWIAAAGYVLIKLGIAML